MAMETVIAIERAKVIETTMEIEISIMKDREASRKGRTEYDKQIIQINELGWN